MDYEHDEKYMKQIQIDTMDYNDRSLLNTIMQSCHFMFFTAFFYIYSYIQLMGDFYARKYFLYV